MISQIFTPYEINGLTLKNRIGMAPMGTYANGEGKVTDWHLAHYGTRADGQVGLIIVEATAVTQVGRIASNSLGIWSDDHTEGFKRLAALIQECGSAAGIQLAHSGRKNVVDETIFAPSPLKFDKDRRTPKEMTLEDIEMTVEGFKNAARRSKEAGFDVIEIHAAHGYLISSFLSPLTNKRDDDYGGDEIRRYRLLKEIIAAVRSEWQGPLFVRVSATENHELGNTPETFVRYAKLMKEAGVDLIDCSSGGIIISPEVKYNPFPGYQVPYAEKIRREANIPTAAVGLITEGEQAEEIIQNDRADLVLLGRELIYNPYWLLKIAEKYESNIELPHQYRARTRHTRFGVRTRNF